MKRILAFALVASAINLAGVTSAPANSQADKDAQLAAKVKESIFNIGTGPAARVEIKLRDGTKLKGYVATAAEDHFVIAEEKSGASTEVPFAQIKQVKQVKQVKGNNLTAGAEKVAAVAAGLAAIFVILFFVQRTER
jgi:hypothetical protein